ncbi:MAG: pyrimidine dimer DNA glycosylase/endonuclease V [Ferruginibacter sp.]
MRIWSIHLRYLDSKGLVALWREALLAKNVLEGKTKGYRNHPQLHRFKILNNPLDAINQYLCAVHQEALFRQYNFDQTKFNQPNKGLLMSVTHEQMKYEFKHLLLKLKTRDKRIYNKIKNSNTIDPHPLFEVLEGTIECWEVV